MSIKRSGAVRVRLPCRMDCPRGSATWPANRARCKALYMELERERRIAWRCAIHRRDAPEQAQPVVL